MSVLIKGVAMPKEPWDCPCHDGENGRCNVTKNSCYQIPKDCPLVEVPTPQGELMSDLISRQVGDYVVSDRGIERVINVGDCGSYTTELIIPKEVFIEAYQKWIEDLSSTQKKGEWIKEYWNGEHTRKCSACNITQTVTTYRGKVNFNYCPYCGADMRGEQE